MQSPAPWEPSGADGIFVIPVLGRFLIYAPLHATAALVDRAAAHRLHQGPAAAGEQGPLAELSRALAGPGEPPPAPRSGDLAPAFLGLLPTRGCNLACRYCGFQACGRSRAMSLRLVRDAIDWYLGLVAAAGEPQAEVHFFGGEPFFAPEVLDLAVPYARARAREVGCALRTEVATNGVYDERRARWAADNIDTIVLSLDGPADIQNRHRPASHGRPSAEAAERSARIFSEGATELSLRACVTSETVSRVPEIAGWFCAEFRPTAVSFEPLQPSAESQAAGLEPPDPWQFAREFMAAARILEAHGVEPVYATADIGARRVSFCPVARDAAIVSPGGEISACYLLPQEWQARGLDLRLGRMAGGRARLDARAVARARELNVYNKPHCARCFCRWHCAGGCHVNHRPPDAPDAYDRLCVQTRIIALCTILRTMGCGELTAALLDDRPALERAVGQASDRLVDVRCEP